MSPEPRGPGGVRHWIWCGVAGGFLLGMLEATERAITLRPFLPGWEPLGWWVVVTGFVTLAGLAVGVIAGLTAGAGALMAAMAPGGRGAAAARRALIGLLCAAAVAGWLLLSLTLTTRFDRVLDRGPFLVGAAAIAGAMAAPLIVALARRWFGDPRRWPARAGGVLLLALLPFLYMINLLFAPQSSVGVHVVLDTVTLFAALFALQLLGPAAGRTGTLRAAFVLAVLLVGTHLIMDASPRIASLAKTRGATSRRAIRATAWLLDVDRDGLSPRWLTAGWDTAPFDSREPAHLVRRMFPRPGAAVPVAAAPAAPAPVPPLPPRVRRILFVTIDALREDASRGDRPTPLGTRRPPTPTLDSLARASAVFAAAYTPASGTEDTFNSFFKDAGQPGAIGHEPPAGWFAERLIAAGWRVAAFMDFPRIASQAWGWPDIQARHEGDPSMADEAIDALAAGAGPALVWVHWMPLHGAVLNPLSPQAYFPESQRRRYADGLAEVDAVLARMLVRLRGTGLAESTLVVLSADHGEELGGHGHFHHNLSLYEPAVRVPLWLSGPGVVPGERPDVVPQRDLHPTLLEAAGIDAAGSPSRSLWPALADPSRRMPQDPIYMFLPQRGFSRKYSWIPSVRGQAALVDPVARRKVMLDLGRERFEAYDLAADPREIINMAGTGLDWIAPMQASLDSALEANAMPPAAQRARFTP